jgi:replicative superfamily II helicase
MLAIPYRNLAIEKYHEMLEFFDNINLPSILPSDYIKLIEGPGVNKTINATRIAVCTYEHCLAILSSGMSIIDADSERRLRQLIRIIMMNEAHMLWDDSRGKIVNQLIGLARLMNISLLLMIDTLDHYQWQTITMRLGHKFIDDVWSLLPHCDYWELPGLHQRRYVQHYVEVDNINYLIIMEGYCLHAIAHNNSQSVIIFCHTRAHCNIMYNKLIIMIRKD